MQKLYLIIIINLIPEVNMNITSYYQLSRFPQSTKLFQGQFNIKCFFQFYLIQKLQRNSISEIFQIQNVNNCIGFTVMRVMVQKQYVPVSRLCMRQGLGPRACSQGVRLHAPCPARDPGHAPAPSRVTCVRLQAQCCSLSSPGRPEVPGAGLHSVLGTDPLVPPPLLAA